uniref:DUF834 domain-containing protein n=1 Tax=Oryza meridionalis TaxID=40149 RepID=A0A0E0EP61_9ORYZ
MEGERGVARRRPSSGDGRETLRGRSRRCSGERAKGAAHLRLGFLRRRRHLLLPDLAAGGPDPPTKAGSATAAGQGGRRRRHGGEISDGGGEEPARERGEAYWACSLSPGAKWRGELAWSPATATARRGETRSGGEGASTMETREAKPVW